ncbi:type II secretion system major pseudopilin GspG [Haliovirga abyssi]|uniref:Type II secretion system core protein G n=1 Tax=Haliovirga abyssi TaxID=2996794 RepID=A0AAU9DED0_9FUSO|nr:type II secretion system major pseudopilin GspG [Haliovirga abyssi]BDU51700.1 type II secretion system protein GspG [Haliovirga abyssi]
MNKKKENGFTLIEIIIVVVIIGFLAATIGPNLFNRVSQAEKVTTKNQIKIIQMALDNYWLDNKNYPTTEQGLRALTEKPITYPIAGNWNGPYLEKKEIPKDAWGNKFEYRSPGYNNPEKYDIWSNGEDGIEGGKDSDDITNW